MTPTHTPAPFRESPIPKPTLRGTLSATLEFAAFIVGVAILTTMAGLVVWGLSVEGEAEVLDTRNVGDLEVLDVGEIQKVRLYLRGGGFVDLSGIPNATVIRGTDEEFIHIREQL